MQVLYLTTVSLDERSLKGRHEAIPLVLRGAGLDVVTVDRVGRFPRLLALLANRLFLKLLRRRLALNRCRPLLGIYAAKMEREVRRTHPDVVVLAHSVFLAYAHLEVPTVIWTDAVFGGMVDYYPQYVGLSKMALHRGHDAERSALDHAAAAVFLSDWAAEGARSLYATPDTKTYVIPFGGVQVSVPTDDEVLKSIEHRASQEGIHLVWMGREWSRKGGDVAVETAQILRSRGHDVLLTLIGGSAPRLIAQQPWVQDLGRLDRSKACDREIFATAFQTSHVHLLPSRAECMGLGIAEASSYGVPSVTSSTGGIASALVDGMTGIMVPADGTAQHYADAVERILADPETFSRFAHQAREDYVDRLSYTATGTQMRHLLESLVHP